MIVAAIVIAAAVVAVCLRVWRNLPSREFPADGQHAPRRINQNRGDQR